MKRILLFAILTILTSPIFSQTVTNNDSTKIVELPKWVVLNIISELKTTDLIIEQNNLISEQNDLQKKQISELIKLNQSFAEKLVQCQSTTDECEFQNLEHKKKIEFLTAKNKRMKWNFVFTVSLASLLIILK